jgi:hypothetical protein
LAYYGDYFLVQGADRKAEAEPALGGVTRFVWGGHKAICFRLQTYSRLWAVSCLARCIGVSTAPLVSLVGGAGAAL